MSSNFAFDSAIIGDKAPTNVLEQCRLVDYHTSDESLRSLASMLVIWTQRVDPKQKIENVFHTHQHFQRQFLQLSDGKGQHGLLVILTETTSPQTIFMPGDKLSHKLNGVITKSTKKDHKTKVIVNLTALGLNTSEISSVLNLTCRGVEYHLDKAKQKLGASNKANLVFKANQYGWI
ncbi:helix-turn-helix transcriptional regulator [Ferrimonas lipolytica]|uniref:HTH luxR-type domain-containing protein n=1 Tax=Ferrimonas lipolytica TaxID=2724191 RepID=A0A6H1UC54_9GAMM|nr:LuxR C-terminal-related transcriptional regulator [Ferrimonas lipolytica]QIZ76641.1 hypothetical protein HER31_07020 [Ferrimonas lipolytica]